MTNVGVIGSGIVGQILAKAFLAEGYTVMLGTRNTAKKEVVLWQESDPGATTGTFQDVEPLCIYGVYQAFCKTNGHMLLNY